MSKELPIRVAGVTKDGVYAAEKNITLEEVGDTVVTFPRVITENGYQNITVKLDDQGVLQGIQIERWDPTS